MVTHDDLETLASLPLFESVPRAELDWLSARGDVQHLEPDTIMRDVGASIEEMWIVLAGRLAVHVAKGDTWRRFYDTGPGSVLGAMPFSRLRNAPARLIVEEKTTLCALARSHFPELVRECPELTSALVHHLLDRARNYRTAELHDERMLSLGRLAAGLAHELNNPASAASSHARALGPLLDDMPTPSRTRASLTSSSTPSTASDRCAWTPVRRGVRSQRRTARTSSRIGSLRTTSIHPPRRRWRAPT